jgi:hypothetical protein
MRSPCRGRCRDFRFRSLRSRAPLAAGCLRALRCRTPPGPGPGRAVGPAGRLRCDARVGVAPPNSCRNVGPSQVSASPSGGRPRAARPWGLYVCSPSVRCARTTAASQSTKRAARADPAAALLAALERPRARGRATTRVLAGVAFGVLESTHASSMPLSKHGVRKESVRAEPFDCAQDRLVEALLAGHGAHQEARICLPVSGDELLFVNRRWPA